MLLFLHRSQKKSPVEEVEPEEDESDSEEEETLPITAYKDEILESIQKNKVFSSSTSKIE